MVVGASEGRGAACLNPKYLNTDDSLEIPADVAQRGEGQLIPVHNVVQIMNTLPSLSLARFVRDLTLPAILDECS